MAAFLHTKGKGIVPAHLPEGDQSEKFWAIRAAQTLDFLGFRLGLGDYFTHFEPVLVEVGISESPIIRKLPHQADVYSGQVVLLAPPSL